MNNDFKPNSHRFKEGQRQSGENEKRAKKVISGNAKVKKKTEISKVKNAFVAENVRNVGSYIFMDVLIPAAKKMLEDIVVDGVHMLMYGESGKGARRSNANYVSYDRFSRRPEPATSSYSRRSSFLDFDTITFATRGEAETVLRAMDDIMADYHLVRVADLYDLAGLSCDYPGMDYGWTDIRSAEVVHVRDGYTIKLPRAIPIR